MLENHIATIASGTSVSSEIPANGLLLSGIFTDPNMTNTSMTFQAALKSGGPYAAISDGAGGVLSKTFVAGQYVPLEPQYFGGVNFLVIVLGSTESAARILNLAVRAIS